MSRLVSFTSEELDVLKEVTNIGMGQAGSTLAEVLGSFVTLRVPEVRMVEAGKLQEALAPFSQKYQAINVVRQAFYDGLKGESILIFGGKSFHSLVEVLGYGEDDAALRSRQREMLMEISNAINGTCLLGLGEQLGFSLQLSPPVLAGYDQSSADFYNIVFGGKEIFWQETLLLEVQFHIQEKDFFCEILMFFAEESLNRISEALAKLLDG